MNRSDVDSLIRDLAAQHISRRQALRIGSGVLGAAAVSSRGTRRASARQATPEALPAAQAIPMTGQAVPELAGFDEVISGLMAKWDLPGGQLAVAKDGRLVFNRGYGLADVEQNVPVQPDNLFRIASASKTITSVAILTLVDASLLTLEDKVFPLLALQPAANATIDPRLDEITVTECLVHAGGWDSRASFDPQYLPWSRMAAAAMGLADPAEATTIVRYMLGVPLDFDPGSKQVYSNFGFNVVGRVIEHVSGMPYGAYVRDHVLIPAGITDMRLGRTRLVNRAPGEVRYYSPAGLGLQESAFWGEGYVPMAYGHYYMEALDSHGGWIASAEDLVRFTLAVDGQRGQALLSPEALEAMLTTPRPRDEPPGSSWNKKPVTAGLGWDVEHVAGGVTWSHGGALEGACSVLPFHGTDGLVFAFVFNTLPIDFRTFFLEAGEKIQEVAGSIQTWPTHDLFD